VQAANVPTVIYANADGIGIGGVTELGDGYTATAIDFNANLFVYTYQIKDSTGNVLFEDLDIAYVGYYGGLFDIVERGHGTSGTVYKADGAKMFPQYSNSAFNYYPWIRSDKLEADIPEYFIVTSGSRASGDVMYGVVDKSGAVILPLQSEYIIILCAGGYYFGRDQRNSLYSAFLSIDGTVTVEVGNYAWLLYLDKDGSAEGYFYFNHQTEEDVFVELPKLAPTSTQPTQTTDSPSTWAIVEVSSAIEVGLVPENLQKNYTQPVSRGDVAQMFINLIEKSSGQSIDAFLAAQGASINNNAFTDTTDKAVLAANALGIINGVGNNRFDPNGTLTRAQIAAIINRLARTLDVDTEGYTHEFTDVAGHWVNTELGWPVYAGVVNGIGDNKYNPDGQLTTEQAIAITYRALQSLK